MKCPNCSANIPSDATECEFCGHRITSVTEFLAQNKIPSVSAPSSAGTASPQPATMVMNPLPTPATSQAPPSPPENPYENHSQAPQKNEIPNHMLWAVISTVAATFFSMCTCCFIPLGLPSGIVAITFANKVNTLLAMGDVAGAKEASSKAKLWSWVTTAIAIIFGLWFVFSIMLNVLGVMGGDKNIFEEFRTEMESNR
jgi:predicted secreted protein